MKTTRFVTETLTRRGGVLRGAAAMAGTVALGAPALAQAKTVKLGGSDALFRGDWNCSARRRCKALRC